MRADSLPFARLTGSGNRPVSFFLIVKLCSAIFVGVWDSTPLEGSFFGSEVRRRKHLNTFQRTIWNYCSSFKELMCITYPDSLRSLSSYSLLIFVREIWRFAFLSKSLSPKKAVENPFIIERRIHNRLFARLTALARRLSPLKKVLRLAFGLPKNCYVVFKGTFGIFSLWSHYTLSRSICQAMPFIYLPISSVPHRIFTL